MKFALHDAMLGQGISNEALGLRLGLPETGIGYLRDPLCQSAISQLKAALHAVGLPSGSGMNLIGD